MKKTHHRRYSESDINIIDPDKINFRKKSLTYTNLVFSGGSVKGIAMIGVLDKLVQEKIIDLDNIEGVAGTSVGSLIGLMVVMKYRIEDMLQFVFDLDLKNSVKPNLSNLIDKYGLEDGKGVYNILEKTIEKKYNEKHINFKRLYELTKINFTVVGSCLTTKKIVYFNHINTPTFKVSMAIRISISIPGFFCPVLYQGDTYIDGCVLNNYPIDVFKDQLDKTIGIQICGEYQTKYDCLEEYLSSILNLCMYSYNQKLAENFVHNTIKIENISNNISTINFDIDVKTRNDLYLCGIEACNIYLNKLFKS